MVHLKFFIPKIVNNLKEFIELKLWTKWTNDLGRPGRINVHWIWKQRPAVNDEAEYVVLAFLIFSDQGREPHFTDWSNSSNIITNNWLYCNDHKPIQCCKSFGKLKLEQYWLSWTYALIWFERRIFRRSKQDEMNLFVQYWQWILLV